jgi:two-component sensor histidine kinase
MSFSVADNGIGLPPEMDLASQPSLGLQLVPLFVEQLHGSMVIERERGTRFAIRIPEIGVSREFV